MSELIKYAISSGIIGGILGYLLRLLVEHRLAVSRAKETIHIAEFNGAAVAFRSAFIEVQRLLDESKSFEITVPRGTRVKTILERHVAEHERAMFAFRPYVPRRKLKVFDKAWKAYYSQENKYAECLSEYDPIHVTSSIVDGKHEEETQKLVLDRINDLLKFAAPE